MEISCKRLGNKRELVAGKGEGLHSLGHCHLIIWCLETHGIYSEGREGPEVRLREY